MVGWHHPLNGHEFEQTPGDSEGQGSLVYCSSWDCKEFDMTLQLNKNTFKNLLRGQITIKKIELHKIIKMKHCKIYLLFAIQSLSHV